MAVRLRAKLDGDGRLEPGRPANIERIVCKGEGGFYSTEQEEREVEGTKRFAVSTFIGG